MNIIFILIILVLMTLLMILKFANDFKTITGHKIKIKNVFKLYVKYTAYCKTNNIKAFYKNLDRKEL